MDSPRYWVQEIHVDGFRFDLATTIAREQVAVSTRFPDFSTPSGGRVRSPR
jgi:glycogen operon protein